MHGKRGKRAKSLAPWEYGMYRKKTQEQMEFPDFILPFGGTLNRQNRWIQLAELIPWEEFEAKYSQCFVSVQFFV